MKPYQLNRNLTEGGGGVKDVHKMFDILHLHSYELNNYRVCRGFCFSEESDYICISMTCSVHRISVEYFKTCL